MTKTTALRLDDKLHMEAVAAAELSGQTLSDFIRDAIEDRTIQVAADPATAEKAQAALAALDAETADRRAALDRFAGKGS